MKILSFATSFVAILFLCGCNSESCNEVKLYNGLAFHLQDGEMTTDLSDEVSKKFQGYFEAQSFQIPLFRYIKKDNYEIYIGLPYRVQISDLLNFKVVPQDSADLITSKTDSISYSYKKYVHEDIYTIEFIAQNDGNHIYILGVTNSQETSNNLFALDSLSGRIKESK